jgi:DNA-binding response OmpR family regulator
MSVPSEDLRVDSSRRELWVRRNGRWSRRDGLTVRELQLLEALLAAGGRPATRERLLEAVWGGVDGVSPGVVDKHMASLRKKLGAFGRRISSVYGVGYLLS